MAGPWGGQPGVLLFDEVGVVAVGDLHDHGAARTDSYFDAAQELHGVVLDTLATAPPVTALSAGEVPVYVVGGQRNPGGEALYNYRQGGSVRLAACQKPVHHFSFTCLLMNFESSASRQACRMTPAGASRPVHSSKAAAPWCTSIVRPSWVRQPMALASFNSRVGLGL